MLLFLSVLLYSLFMESGMNHEYLQEVMRGKCRHRTIWKWSLSWKGQSEMADGTKKWKKLHMSVEIKKAKSF